ncbi:hypothetical protein ADUPG1_013475 [Aduncisulcus paluster]|uniref:RRM domain-containing protein n=1 Tax=Aduncisulcus paluster TaxID=2918883 RepID=A0ABQ5K339_9EUKA|nr:hypothetical protein ADUPG1_013475 [Aduncisulcus paluster]|eukprot:gnl/Carplike_NY0171/311_a431_3476.p1 GENE.gnl/Carplike_NY0171/311_a431_3476~~gnl/Carplike_NY0171/311_a431_3476.p1  ORF type:complete len:234 (+),score=90.28 gnl/Carplike_NY0171/311_a431_3476:94-795(+)
MQQIQLFIAKLPFRFDFGGLRQAFEEHDVKLGYIRVPRERRGFAFVYYNTEDPEALIEKLNGNVEFLGRKLVVELSKSKTRGERRPRSRTPKEPRAEREGEKKEKVDETEIPRTRARAPRKRRERRVPATDRERSETKIYLGNLPYTTTEEELVGEFKEEFPGIAAEIITWTRTSKSRGFGFVDVKNLDEQEKFLDMFSKGKLQLHDRTIAVEKAFVLPPKDEKKEDEEEKKE